METTLQSLSNDILSAKETSSGTVQWNSNSLEAISYDLFYLLMLRFIVEVDSIAALEALDTDETCYPLLKGVGIFELQEDEPTSGVYYPAYHGYWWVLMVNYKADNYKLAPTSSSDQQIITDIEQYPHTPTWGQSLVWDGIKWAFTYIPVFKNEDTYFGSDVRYDYSIRKWVSRLTHYAYSAVDYNIKVDDDVVFMTATGKKAILPTLGSGYIGKQYTIVNQSSLPITTTVTDGTNTWYVDSTVGWGGMTFVKAYHFITMMWTGSAYVPIKRG